MRLKHAALACSLCYILGLASPFLIGLALAQEDATQVYILLGITTVLLIVGLIAAVVVLVRKLSGSNPQRPWHESQPPEPPSSNQSLWT